MVERKKGRKKERERRREREKKRERERETERERVRERERGGRCGEGYEKIKTIYTILRVTQGKRN